MGEIENHGRRTPGGEDVAGQRGGCDVAVLPLALGPREVYVDAIVEQVARVEAGQRTLLPVREPRAVARPPVPAVVQAQLAGRRHHQDVAVVADAGSAEVRVR